METPPEKLQDLLAEVFETKGTNHAGYILLSRLRHYKLWPSMQLKRFFDKSGLYLLNNSYTRDKDASLPAIFAECRSVVLDMDAPSGENVVVSMSQAVPARASPETFEPSDGDRYELGYEGTMIAVYCHKDVWHFGTSSCPSMDKSRFAKRTKTHGEMFDEALEKLGKTRETFTAALDPSKAYGFILCHHENTHLSNHTDEFGENYAVLVHARTQDRVTREEAHEVGSVAGVHYAKKFETWEAAREHLDGHAGCFGVIATRADGSLVKIASREILDREECDLGNHNVWQNILWVYMQQKPHYKIVDYVAAYAPDLESPMPPTYMVHTAFCTMREVLYELYKSTTHYNPAVGRFKMVREADAVLSPILRFHLAQLRHIQVTYHKESFIGWKVVHAYLCRHTSFKNVRNLIHHFATSMGGWVTGKQLECLQTLDRLLRA